MTMNTEAKPCPLCEAAPKTTTKEPRFVRCSDSTCDLSSYNFRLSTWNALPRRSTKAKEIAEKLRRMGQYATANANDALVADAHTIIRITDEIESLK